MFPVSGLTNDYVGYLFTDKDNNSRRHPSLCFLYADANRFSFGATVMLTTRTIRSRKLAKAAPESNVTSGIDASLKPERSLFLTANS